MLTAFAPPPDAVAPPLWRAPIVIKDALRPTQHAFDAQRIIVGKCSKMKRRTECRVVLYGHEPVRLRVAVSFRAKRHEWIVSAKMET